MTLIEVETYLGERITGESWSDILHHLKVTNFSRPQDLAELMSRLQMRVKQATGEVIAIGTHSDFGHELARIGFLRILKEEKSSGDTRANNGGNLKGCQRENTDT